MEIFLTKSPSLPVLRKAMAERDDLILHITDVRHTWFYSSRISEMHVISDDLMSQIVQISIIILRIFPLSWTANKAPRNAPIIIPKAIGLKNL